MLHISYIAAQKSQIPTSDIYVAYMSKLCDRYATYMQHICHIYVTYMLHIYVTVICHIYVDLVRGPLKNEPRTKNVIDTAHLIRVRSSQDNPSRHLLDI